MRVIGGEFRSRVLRTLPDLTVRPTPDRLRETLFNILADVIVGTVFIDAYAGSGSVGIEALSRGAAKAIFIEKSRPAAEVIQANLESLGLRSRSAVWTATVQRRITGDDADIVFIDPPYPLEKEYAISMNLLGENPPRIWAIAQHSRHFEMAGQYGKLSRSRSVVHGENVLSFYRTDGLG